MHFCKVEWEKATTPCSLEEQLGDLKRQWDGEISYFFLNVLFLTHNNGAERDSR